MKAVLIEAHGGLEALKIVDRPRPTAGPGRVVVDLKAAALNHLDVWVRKGVPGHKFPLPIIPGCDGAGVVREVGAGVTGVEVGQRVLLAPGMSCGFCMRCAEGRDHLCRTYGILGETRDGTCAECVEVPARNVIPISDHLSFHQAAAFPLAYLTAWGMIVDRCGVKPGDDVLVWAAGSGVSVASIQILRLIGARVIAVASTQSKVSAALALGASLGICASTQDVNAEVRAATGKAGVDFVVDHVGEATFGTSLRLLKKGGAVVTCGATSGPKLEADLRLIFFKSLSILGSTMGSLGALHRLTSLVGARALVPVVDRVIPLHQVADGHAALEARGTFGKVVLEIGA